MKHRLCWEYKTSMKLRKTGALLLALAMLLALSADLLAAEEPGVLPEAVAGDGVIIHTNDLHSYLDGDLRYSHVAGLKDHYEALGADVLLVDAGDAIQGTAYGSMDQGQTVHELMLAADYDFAVMGNHEFDYGMTRALEVAQGDLTYLSCNFRHAAAGAAGKNVLDPYAIVELGGRKTAVIGVTTPETLTSSFSAYFQNDKGEFIYGIDGGADGQALYDTVQKTVDAAADEGAETVILLGHLGVDESAAPYTSREVIANTAGVDLMIDGHSHTLLGETVRQKDGGETLLVQCGEYFETIGVVVIDGGSGAAEAFRLDADDLAAMGVAGDGEIKAMEDGWIAELDTRLGRIIGHADITLDNYDAAGDRLVRRQATNTGAFCADALLHLFETMELRPDAAIINGGGIRNKALTGDLSYKSMKEIHTFGNVACLVEVRGQQILDALEWGAQMVGTAESGSFFHVAGMKYTIDTSIPSTVRQDDKGGWAGGPTGEYRVTDVQVLDRETGLYAPIDLQKTYRLAGYNYTLRNMGDGCNMLQGAVNILDYVMEDYMVLAAYTASFPVDESTGLPTIGEEYSWDNAADRITIRTAPAEAQPAAPAEPTEPVSGALYVVQKGDSLWKIAHKTLGSGTKWTALYEANRETVQNADIIYVGQTLVIPAV